MPDIKFHERKLYKVDEDNWLSLTIAYLEEMHYDLSENLGDEDTEVRAEQLGRLIDYLQKTN